MSMLSKIAHVQSGCIYCRIVPIEDDDGKVTYKDVQLAPHCRDMLDAKAEYDSRPVDQETCEHEFDPDEGFHCLHCDKDGSEEVFAAAYDRLKDERKYGDD